MNTNPLDSELWTRRRWIRHFVLGSAVALGANRGWRGTLLADISPNTTPSDILPISLDDFPGLTDYSTPSIQLQLSVFDEIIMINRAPYSGEFYVLSSICTHQGCIVNKWDIDENIVCLCHGSNYEIDGTVIYGAAGPSQPPLASYEFSYDGDKLLQVKVPGLNLKINSLAVESKTATSKRLRLTFPVHLGSDYRVRYTPSLLAEAQPVQFATSATGPANNSFVRALTGDPLSVWVDDMGQQGFYSIELILYPY